MAKNDNRYTAPLKVFLLYVGAAFVLICVFRFIFPYYEKAGERIEILACFNFWWRLSGGLLTFIQWFPMLAFSALVIPFGLKEHTEGGYAGTTFVGKKGFSGTFLKYVTWPIITAAISAVLYSLLFFLVLPLTANARSSMADKSVLYNQARTKAEERIKEDKWTEAFHFIQICEKVWSGGLEKERFMENLTAAQIQHYQSANERTFDLVPIWKGLPGTPLTSAEALMLAQEAFKNERYYDAAWLAMLTQRLAKSNAAEVSTAVSLASQSWEKIKGLEPNAREKESHRLYRMKRDGFEAMGADNWISAYYIFHELSRLTPHDPDVIKFLDMSKTGVAKVAFFIDEMNLFIGNVLTDIVFSLPDIEYGEKLGRLTISIASLAIFPDYAFAWGVEASATDNQGKFRYRANADYAKLIPVVLKNQQQNEEEKTHLLLQALDRNNQENQLKPVWYSGDSPNASAYIDNASYIMLSVGYKDLMLLSKMKEGPGALNIWELFTAEKKFADYGYAPQIFRAEIIRRLGESFFFLSMAILALVLGWRYRARVKPRYVFVPMLVILPLVFYGIVFIYRNLLNGLAIHLSLGMGFTAALVYVGVGAAVCFLISLIVLSSQHG